jgi:hypothetical protein
MRLLVALHFQDQLQELHHRHLKAIY